MADFYRLLELQLMMFLLMGTGLFLRKKEILKDDSKQVLTNLLITVILPCNIINSFYIEFTASVLMGFASIFFIALLIQIGCLMLSKVAYNWVDEDKKAVLQYATVCSNAGFMGNPIAEGIYGSEGLLYASIYLIPQRIVMWSAGVSCFTKTKGTGVFKRIITHPCIVAVVIGMVIMILGIPLPVFLDETMKSVSGCTMTISMILIGTILADVNFSAVLSRISVIYTFIRLIIIPCIVLVCCLAAGVNSILTGVSVVLAGMPAGSTTAILAAKYDGDAVFASKCVVLSTILSIVTIPIWCMVMNLYF